MTVESVQAARSSEAQKSRERVQPQQVHALVSRAIIESQGHTGFQWWNSSDRLGKTFRSHIAGRTADQALLYVGSRRAANGERIYGLLDGNEIASGKDRQSGSETVSRDLNEVGRLLGNDAAVHAMRILWQVARDKNQVPQDVIAQADELGLFSVAPTRKGKDKKAVMYVPDAETGKIFRIFTDWKYPKTEWERDYLIDKARKLIKNDDIQSAAKNKTLQVVDLQKKGSRYILRTSDPILFSRKDKIKGDGVALRYDFLPPNLEGKDKKLNLDDLVVTIPGWSAPYDSGSVNRLGQEYADLNGSRTLMVNGRVDKIVPEDLFLRAQEIAEFIIRSGVKTVTLTGHSQGGPQAADVAWVLQMKRKEQLDHGIDPPTVPLVKGVVLHDPVGLYDQGEIKQYHFGPLKFSVDYGAVKLAYKFAKDGVVTLLAARGIDKKYARLRAEKPDVYTEHPPVEDAFGKANRAGQDIGRGIWQELRASRREYFRRAYNEIKGMSHTTADRKKRLAELEMPIAIVTGEDDPISRPDVFVPDYKNSQWHTTVDGQNVREGTLKQGFFAHAAYVRMVVESKSRHHGQPLFRERGNARNGLGLVRRGQEAYAALLAAQQDERNERIATPVESSV